MRILVFVMTLASAGTLLAQVPQEKKPVPKDSVRVSIAGCTKGYVFTVGARMPDVASGMNIPPGTHLRMNGPKKMIAEIDAYTSSRVAITGLMRKGQPVPGGFVNGAVTGPPQIDVEGWSPATGTCPS